MEREETTYQGSHFLLWFQVAGDIWRTAVKLSRDFRVPKNRAITAVKLSRDFWVGWPWQVAGFFFIITSPKVINNFETNGVP